jgi:hypothetical protein
MIPIITFAFDTNKNGTIQKEKSKTLHVEQYVSNQQISGRCYKNFY